MLKKLLISVAFIISMQSCAFAQEVKKDTVPETKAEKAQEKKVYSITQFVHESYLFFRQPVKWKGRDWLTLGIITVATASAMPFDKAMYNSTQGQQNYYHSVFIEGGRLYGEWYSIGSVACLFGFYGLVTKDIPAKKITLELLQAGIYSELVTMLFKTAIGRARPRITENSNIFEPFNATNDNYHSLPSGHATASMALSTVMSRHARTVALKILAYVPAGFTLFSRIYQNQHWLSDVVPGAAIGFFAGNWVVDLHEGKAHRINVTSVAPLTISFNLDRVSIRK